MPPPVQNTSNPSSTQGQVKPELSDALRILMPIASNWKTIGTFLKVQGSLLDNIKADNQNQSVDCLREMLSHWLKQINPQPTWQALASAVEPVNPAKAKEVKDQFLK